MAGGAAAGADRPDLRRDQPDAGPVAVDGAGRLEVCTMGPYRAGRQLRAGAERCGAHPRDGCENVCRDRRAAAAGGLVRGSCRSWASAALRQSFHLDGTSGRRRHSALDVVLGLVAVFWTDCPCARNGEAIVITGLLLLAVRSQRDLITWIAPRSELLGPWLRRRAGLKPDSDDGKAPRFRPAPATSSPHWPSRQCCAAVVGPTRNPTPFSTVLTSVRRAARSSLQASRPPHRAQRPAPRW